MQAHFSDASKETPELTASLVELSIPAEPGTPVSTISIEESMEINTPPKRFLTRRQISSIFNWNVMFGLKISASSTNSTTENEKKTKYRISVRYPGLLNITNFILEFEWARSVWRQECSISTQIRLQNRVPDDSPFIMACRDGSVHLLEQLLRDGKGGVNDRTVSNGTTPLLASSCDRKFLMEH